MRGRFLWYLWLLSGAFWLLSCLKLPEQPGETQPYALVVFPQAIHLQALDTQTVDPRMYVRAIRVSPGEHRLRLVYEGGSPQHAGQQAAPFLLDTQAGHQYVFEPKTCGIFWRPAVADHVLISGYCTTHTCTETETQRPPKIPSTPKCNTD